MPLQEEVPLGNPDILICSVGTEIFFEKPGSDGAEPQPDKKWTQLLDQGWNRQAALDAAAQLSELAPQVVTSMPVNDPTLYIMLWGCRIGHCSCDAQCNRSTRCVAYADNTAQRFRSTLSAL